MVDSTPNFCNVGRKAERDVMAENILAEAKNRSLAHSPPGLRSPVIDLSGCSEFEKKLLQDYIEQRKEAAIAAETAPMITTNVVTDMALWGSAPAISCVRDISRLLGRQTSQNGSASTPYALMQLFLSRVYLRWYDGKFYYFDQGVYRAVSDLKALVLGTLELELAQGKTNQWLRSVVELLEANPHIRSYTAQLRPEEVPFSNGIFNIFTLKLRPITPYDFFVNHIAVPYPVSSASCPVFDMFLKTVADGRPEIIDAILELLGYLLTSDMNGKCFFVLQGAGDTGKSVLGNLIASFFNPEAVSHLDISRLGDRFSPSVLQGKLLNICMDLPDGRIRKEAAGTIKQITGGDSIEIEGKFRDAKSLHPTCKLLFGTNFPLRMDHDEAFLTRCVVIPFTNIIPKKDQDKQLLERLMVERPVIAAKALCAYTRLCKRNYQFIGLGGGVFSGWVPLTQQLEGFLNDCCIFGPGLHTPTSILFNAFNVYCTAHHFTGPADVIQFSRQLNQLCQGRITPKKKRSPAGNLNGYDGIAICPDRMEELG